VKKNEKNHRGGKRLGAGRKSIFGEKTANITIRHRKSVIDAVKKKYPRKGELTEIGREWLDKLVP
jgi:hypothetical protein